MWLIYCLSFGSMTRVVRFALCEPLQFATRVLRVLFVLRVLLQIDTVQLQLVMSSVLMHLTLYIMSH